MRLTKLTSGETAIYVNPERIAWVQPVTYGTNHKALTRVWFSATEAENNYVEINAEISVVVAALTDY